MGRSPLSADRIVPGTIRFQFRSAPAVKVPAPGDGHWELIGHSVSMAMRSRRTCSRHTDAVSCNGRNLPSTWQNRLIAISLIRRSDYDRFHRGRTAAGFEQVPSPWMLLSKRRTALAVGDTGRLFARPDGRPWRSHMSPQRPVEAVRDPRKSPRTNLHTIGYPRERTISDCGTQSAHQAHDFSSRGQQAFDEPATTNPVARGHKRGPVSPDFGVHFTPKFFQGALPEFQRSFR